MANPKFVGAVAVSGALAIGALVGASLGTPSITSASSGSSGTTTTAPAGATPNDPAQPGDHGPGRGPRFGGGAELEAAATALGMSVDDLRTELEGGKTIAEVAEAKGVDRQTVIDAMVAAASKRLDDAKAALPDRMADVVDGKGFGPGGMGDGAPGGMGGGPGGMGGGRPGRPALKAAADVLGVTEDELRTELRDGTSLADVAQAKGVDVQKVIDALVAEAKTHLDEAVKAGRLTQAQADERLADMTTHITDMVNGKAPQGGPHHP